MWSLSGASRSLRLRLRPHPQPHHLQLPPTKPAAAAPPCSSFNFSTTPTLPSVKKKTTIKMSSQPSGGDGPADRYSRLTREGLLKRIEYLERQLETHSNNNNKKPATTAKTTTTEPATERVAASLAETEEEKERKGASKNKNKNKNTPESKKTRSFDLSKYSTRLVALKIAYLGKNYGGFEYQASSNIPTVEEELWKALVKGCLISPQNPDEVNFDPWDYSKCGRTDRGVSAFGQVIGIRMRSNRPLPKEEETEPTEEEEEEVVVSAQEGEEDVGDAAAAAAPPKREFDDFIDEVPYARVLNRLLPPDIRVLAWCPTTPADFSARHHCRERQYRYFFTQPAYSPIPDSMENPANNKTHSNKAGWLDIDAMRAAAKKFEGLNDFRNFCHIDASKQMQSFKRRIYESDIVEFSGDQTAMPHLSKPELRPGSTTAVSSSSSEEETRMGYPKVYYFHVRGSAFLWHQIRCMISVLFLVGQGYEDPSIIDRLLDIEAEPRRPVYNLASDLPLVLWDCIFPNKDDASAAAAAAGSTVTDGLDWVYQGEENPLFAYGRSGLVDHVWEQWRERKMDELLASQLLNVITSKTDISLRRNKEAARRTPPSNSAQAFEGGNTARTVGKYVPLLRRERVLSPQETYEKDAQRQGYDSVAQLIEAKWQKRMEARAKAAAAAAATTAE
ncbi:pseudouridine synthase [Poronia punctata]|nr:pseudouridine synthase [Poronia punctata]